VGEFVDEVSLMVTKHGSIYIIIQ